MAPRRRLPICNAVGEFGLISPDPALACERTHAVPGASAIAPPAAKPSQNPIGEALRRQRIETLGLGLREMARLLDIAPAHLTDIEKGRRNPSEDLLIRLAKRYEMPIEVLRAGWNKPEAVVAEMASRNPTFAAKVPELMRAVKHMPPDRWDELIAEAKRLSKQRGKR